MDQILPAGDAAVLPAWNDDVSDRRPKGRVSMLEEQRTTYTLFSNERVSGPGQW
jgi:hypothetical protein